MNTIRGTSPIRYKQNHPLTPVSRMVGDMRSSTMTTIPAVIKQPHDNSLISFEQNLPQHVPNPEERFEKFTTSLLKNKTLLVPRRLALKRQRATLESPTRKLDPIYTDTLQMELGNPDELILHTDADDDELTTMISQNVHISPTQNRMQSTSNHTSPLRGDTPHTLPTDISLLYRYVILTKMF